MEKQGWKAARLLFLVVNSMAVYYNLVPEDKIKAVMMTPLGQDAGSRLPNFTLGVRAI